MQEVARVELLDLDNGKPGIRLTSTEDFRALSPIEKAAYLGAAIAFCDMLLSSLAEDYPEHRVEIEDAANADIEPHGAVLN